MADLSQKLSYQVTPKLTEPNSATAKLGQSSTRKSRIRIEEIKESEIEAKQKEEIRKLSALIQEYEE